MQHQVKPGPSRPARIIAVILAFATLLAFGPAAGAADAPVLRMWTRSGTDTRAAWDAITAKFTERSGIKVELFSATTDFEQRLARAMAGNDLPDAIINDTASLGQFVALGIASEIDRATIKGSADITDRAWQGARGFDGKYYAVPFSVHPFVLFIRRDWRVKLGLPVPKTWADLQALSKAFAERDPDGNGKPDTYGLEILGSVTRGYASWYLSSYIWQAGGEFVRDAGNGKFRGALADPPVATAVRYVRNYLCVDKSAQPGAINAAPFDAAEGSGPGSPASISPAHGTSRCSTRSRDATSTKSLPHRRDPPTPTCWPKATLRTSSAPVSTRRRRRHSSSSWCRPTDRRSQ